MTMRRKAWFRPFAALLTVWFPLIVGEPSLLQSCPEHGAVVATAGMPATGHAGHAMTGAHAGHAAAMHPASPDHDSAPGSTHHDCTCIGCCTGGAANVVSPSAPEIAVAVVVNDNASPARTAEAQPRAAPAFSRPYTTGPPRV